MLENVGIICRKYFKTPLNGSEAFKLLRKLHLGEKHELSTAFFNEHLRMFIKKEINFPFLLIWLHLLLNPTYTQELY